MAARRFSTALIFLALISPAHAFGQSAPRPIHTVRGVVVDPSGASVPGASVAFIDAAGEEHRTTSDAQGRFDLVAPLTLPVTVVASARGFDTIAMTIDSPGAPITLSLPPARVEEQVTVTATIHPESVV